MIRMRPKKFLVLLLIIAPLMSIFCGIFWTIFTILLKGWYSRVNISFIIQCFIIFGIIWGILISPIFAFLLQETTTNVPFEDRSEALRNVIKKILLKSEYQIEERDNSYTVYRRSNILTIISWETQLHIRNYGITLVGPRMNVNKLKSEIEDLILEMNPV